MAKIHQFRTKENLVSKRKSYHADYPDNSKSQASCAFCDITLSTDQRLFYVTQAAVDDGDRNGDYQIAVVAHVDEIGNALIDLIDDVRFCPICGRRLRGIINE